MYLIFLLHLCYVNILQLLKGRWLIKEGKVYKRSQSNNQFEAPSHSSTLNWFWPHKSTIESFEIFFKHVLCVEFANYV